MITVASDPYLNYYQQQAVPPPPSGPPSSSEYNYLSSLFKNVSKITDGIPKIFQQPPQEQGQERQYPNQYYGYNQANKNNNQKNQYYSPGRIQRDDDDDFNPATLGPKYYEKIGDYLKDEMEDQLDQHHSTNIGLILGLALGIPFALCFIGIIIRIFFKRKCKDLMIKMKLIRDDRISIKHNFYNKNSIDKNQTTPIQCRDDPWAMDRSKVIVEYQSKLGSGAFCNVHKGHIKGPAAIRRVFPDLIVLQKFTDCDVAVKLLPSFADDIARSDFNQEINFMKSLNYHPHLVCMLGYVSDPRNPLLLVEYCSNGDLLHLIRNHRTEIEHGYENSDGLKIKNLVSFAWQISDGLGYLNSIGCIHRDVAARNVLVEADYTCKIADFGLCRLTDNLLYTARGGRLPLRWMAPESLKSFEYSFKTDVWSYGILLWELLSLGDVPYNSIENQELLTFLESGQRLSKPIFCPHELYDVMKSCWKDDPCLRPDFTEICKILRNIIEAANEDYGYLIPLANLASIDAYHERNSINIKVDDV